MFGLDFNQISEAIPKLKEGADKALAAFESLKAEQTLQREMLEKILVKLEEKETLK